MRLPVRFRNREERAPHAIKISRFGRMNRYARPV
jgi:hypothetical protein